MTFARITHFVYSIFICFPVFAQVDANYCGPLTNHYGPFDYRADKFTPRRGDQETHSFKRRLVEGAHFTRRVENLQGSQSSGKSGPPGGDLDYTLRVFPNNHRALLSVMRYGEQTGSRKPKGLRYDVECYFERAIRFSADDAIVRMIYSTYLVKNKRQPQAIAQLEQATVIAGENAFTHYNIGLTYFDMKIYDRALASAHRAMALGFERTQLRDLLQAAGQWKEPPATPKPEQ